MVSEGFEESTYYADHDAYLEGHLPSAVFVSWLSDGAGTDQQTGVPAMLLEDTDAFAATMEEKGVGTDRTVVVYDGGDGLLAPRLWWALRRHGHPDVRVLDGGYRQWMEEGRPVDTEQPCPLKVMSKGAVFDTEAHSPRNDLLATCQDVLKAVANPDRYLLVDARNTAQYTGKVRRAIHGGCVPGAISCPRKILLSPSGNFLTITEQIAALEAAGLDVEALRDIDEPCISSPPERKRVVAYCNGGVASCTVLLALARVGVQSAMNYDGSWNEWGNRDDVPLANSTFCPHPGSILEKECLEKD
ncbi:hypothetical protein CYMTET_42521 [Cymbomonas tetramitiformis]|uniref:Sulfurtransferase n=1 Tax=Cymbomonas tetramitiformis TaxID=36881 RepID=A0AAE0C598_9CHLO|nr:hypothetical protein CYMTET_42521 [Cymbomonas tetramitiformis]